MKCNFCQSENNNYANYCFKCGTRLLQMEDSYLYPKFSTLIDWSNNSFLSKLFIGRQQELNTLNNQAETLTAGIGRICAIYGEAGIGKSELLLEWSKRFLHSHPEYKILRISITSKDNNLDKPYSYLFKLINQLLDLPKNTASTEVISELSKVIDLSHSESEKLHRNRGDLQQLYTKILSQYLQNLVKDRQFVIIFDDLQAADAKSFLVISEILYTTQSIPLFICLVFRTGLGLSSIKYMREFQGLPIIRMELNSFSKDESMELLSNLLNTNNIPSGLQNLIFEKSEGNPAFILEMLQMLLNQGVIQPKGNGWIIQKEILKLDLPHSLEKYFNELITPLPEVTKQILVTASVLGKEFEMLVLVDMLHKYIDRLEIQKHLNWLEAENFIYVSTTEKGVVHCFKHPLLQEYFYKTLNIEERKSLHLASAKALEKKLGESKRIAPQLAAHFFEGGEVNRALDLYSFAADEALINHSWFDAENFYRKALNLIPEEKVKADLLTGLGQSLSEQSRYLEAINFWKQALEIYKSENNYDQAARIFARMARASWWLNDLEKNMAYCEEGMKLVENIEESTGVAYLLHECGRTYLFQNELDKAENFCKRALGLANKLGAIDVQAEIFATMGVFPSLTPKEAISYLEAAITIAEKNNLAGSASRAYINLAAIMENLGQIQLALENREKALKAGLKTMDDFFIQSAIINNKIFLGRFEDAKQDLSIIKSNFPKLIEVDNYELIDSMMLESRLEHQLGNFDKASDLALGYIRSQRKLGDVEQILAGNIHLSKILLEPFILESNQTIKNNLDIGIALLQEFIETDFSPEQRYQLMGLLGLMHGYNKDSDRAEAFFNQVNYNADVVISKFDKTQLLLNSARFDAQKLNYVSAIKKFEVSQSDFEGMDARWWLAHTWLETALVYMHLQDTESLERAQNLLREALLVFRHLGCAYYPDLILEKLRVIRQLFKETADSSRLQKRELTEAGRVQTGFIPAELPDIPGWQIAAALEPARETSGDYYDFIKLPDESLGIVIADVGDKGAGAALYMATSRTMLRSFAREDGLTPEKLVSQLNQRIMQDTREGIFLTLVYGILDAQANTFTYCNAGHNPGIFMRPEYEDKYLLLEKTGMLAGLFANEEWQQKTINFSRGETLILYTDGITEAENGSGEFYGDKRLLNILLIHQNESAQSILNAILADVKRFTGDQPVLDDLTVVVIQKNSE